MRLSAPRRLLALSLAGVLVLAGCSDDRAELAGIDDQPAGRSARFEDPASFAPPAGYYDTVDDSSPSALRSTLHDVIDDHQRYPYTSSATDTWDILELADEDPGNSGNILDVYRNASYPKQGGGNTMYNREHSWPKSYGFPNDGSSNYPYTDTHHLFLCDSGYNSSRSNKPYRDCNAGCSEKPTDANNGTGGGSGSYPGHSNWTTGSFTAGTWETWGDRRGDVARAMFYMDLRYEGGTHGVTGHSEPDLVLTDDENLIASSNTGNNESVGYMGMLTVLLQWHLDDPVDTKEQARNDVVYAHQGNRNPFIDDPSYVDCLYNGICGGGGDTTPPAAPAGLVATGGDGSVGLDWADNGEGDLGGYNVYRATSSGGPYSQLNGAPLPTSDYSDSGVGNGTTYYYVVTAVDSSANESADSAEASATPQGGGGTGGAVAWINEFHYDNDGSDTGEFVEVAGSAGSSLVGWSVVGYNGNGGGSYKTVSLSGSLPDQQGGYGTLSFAFSSMQNGSPDGLALVDDTGTVVEFLSYEGSFTATDGPAAGLVSTDVGVSEGSGTPAGESLQRTGSGSAAADFSWTGPLADSPGAVNAGQSFGGGGGDTTPPAAPASLVATAGDATVDLDWADNGEGDLGGYHVHRATSSGGPYSQLTGGPLATSAYTDGSVTNGTTYYYVVTAVDNSGNESADSAEASATPQAAGGGPAVAWINEFHYDDRKSDENEAIEVAGTAGLDLSGWTLVGYNGNGGGQYMTIALSGTLPDQQGGFGTLAFDATGLQNGAPDGIALVDDMGTVVEFLSYEGSFTATDGPAAGMGSVDVGVSESSNGNKNHSLQRVGTGSQGSDFSWVGPQSSSFGSPNDGQSFGGAAPAGAQWAARGPQRQR